MSRYPRAETLSEPGVQCAMLSALLFSLLACHKTPVVEDVATPAPVEAPAPTPVPAPEPVPAPSDDWPGTELQREMHRAFSHRDAAPECAVVTADSEDPLGDLVFLAEEVAMPPHAGMRAAYCVINEHSEAGLDTLVKWSTGPQTEGLARLLFGRLAFLPPEVAATVRDAALAGPHAALVPDPG